MANLYFTNASGSSQWNDRLDWNTAADGSGSAPTEVPWSGTDGSTSASNLFGGGVSGDGPDFNSTDIVAGVTGTCDFPNELFNYVTISGGTFTGSVTNGFTDAYINGGTFNGLVRNQDGATINGGTFNGGVQVVTYSAAVGTINGGTFNGGVSGDYYSINGGTFTGGISGTNYSINGGIFNGGVSLSQFSSISAGTFTQGVNNGHYCTISGGTFLASVQNGDYQSYISGGTFTGGVYNPDGGVINGGTFEITLFTNNGSVTYSSINITSSGTPFTGIWSNQIWSAGAWVSAYFPPFGTCYYTNASTDGTWGNLSNWNSAADGSGTNPTEIPWSGTNGSTSASDLVDASGGVGISLNSSIGAGVTGSCDIINISINGGTISGGTFTGSGFFASAATINGGTFTGSGLSGDSTSINGGTFSGSGLIASYFYINGGTFSGSGFANIGSPIYGGTFIAPAVSVTTDGGNTLLSLAGSANPIVFSFPTPASGGGSDQTIARLLNLPWFINL